ncbi:hypothetical protein MNBD_GAMMA12-3655 [hydrothermal vent metagenome]|uniref:Uncharacterized protein n=1 Tax=hydrothermal vent metagenome TaxID=652676 RepID=A0A3B0XUL3_9ZZZZ
MSYLNCRKAADFNYWTISCLKFIVQSLADETLCEIIEMVQAYGLARQIKYVRLVRKTVKDQFR